MRHVMVSTVFALMVALTAPVAGQPVRDFPGRVVDADNNSGIENLQVKLTPPRASTAPVRIATTDQQGGFVFARLADGPYLVEISQGVHLLYRAEVDTRQLQRLDVALRRR